MSTLGPASDAATVDGGVAHAPPDARERVRRWAPVAVTVVVLIWSGLEAANLVARHTIGAEVYGVLVAILATVAGAASLWLLFARRRHTVATVAVLILWAVIALGGLAGTVAHVVGPDPNHGPVDSRPRPIAAPLIFTLLGAAGGGALFYGKLRPSAANGR